MIRGVYLATAVALILLSGLGHGMLTRRWADHADVRAAAGKLDRLPLTIEGWEARPLQLDARELAVGRIDGYVMRQYLNHATGATAQVLVVCGRPGPIAVHTPDVCYAGAGYAMVAAPIKHPVQLAGVAPAGLWTALMRRETPTGADKLRIYWTWAAAGTFQASDAPRLDFAGEPVLYKLYFVQEVPGEEGAADQEALHQFIRAFLSEFKTAVF
jgi:hypothetical protein